jgi:MFS family permease
VWGIVADTYGRKFGFLATAGFTFVFGIVSALAVNYPMMYDARPAPPLASAPAAPYS